MCPCLGVTVFGSFLSRQWILLVNKNHMARLIRLSCQLNSSRHFWRFSMCCFEYFVQNLTFSGPKAGKIRKNPFYGHMTSEYDVIWRQSMMILQWNVNNKSIIQFSLEMVYFDTLMKIYSNCTVKSCQTWWVAKPRRVDLCKCEALVSVTHDSDVRWHHAGI